MAQGDNPQIVSIEVVDPAAAPVAAPSPAASADPGFLSDWRAVRDNPDLQFAPVQMPEKPEPPGWWLRFLEWLGDVLSPVARVLVSAWPWLKWVLLAMLIAAVLLFLYRLIDPSTLRRRKKVAVEEDWVPETGAALALLEEADRLAAEGRFDEATHLLLMRSVGQIAEARPDLVDPSSTAREIAAEPELGDRARGAFTVIAERVERSLFALRSLSADDWQAARAAYADFAQVRPGALA